MGTEKPGAPEFDRDEWDRVYALVTKTLGGLRRRRAGDLSLSTADLAHELLVRCLTQPNGAVALGERKLIAYVFDQVVRDEVQKKRALKRGGDRVRVSFPPESRLSPEQDDVDLDELSMAMSRLKEDRRPAWDVVVLRYYSNMTILEAAESLAVSEQNVRTAWRYARAFLRDALDTGMTTS